MEGGKKEEKGKEGRGIKGREGVGWKGG